MVGPRDPLDESEFAQMKPAEVRLHQARYFLGRFEYHCGLKPGAPPYTYFTAITYLDAFLAALSSLPDLVSKKRRTMLFACGPLSLVRFLRNVTIHYSVIGAPQQRGGAQHAVPRHIELSFGAREGDSSTMTTKISIKDIRRHCKNRLQRKNGKRSKRVIDAVRGYLTDSKAKGDDGKPIIPVLHEALRQTAAVCGVSLPPESQGDS